MSTTIKDVSKAAKVSIASVSRYINKKENVTKITAKKIEQAIAELNFRPNIAGRNLRTGKTKLIGVMIPSLNNPVFADAMMGIQKKAKEESYTILITSTEYNVSYEEEAIDALISNGVDGLILTVAQEQNNPLLEKLDNSNIPYILLYNDTNSKNRSIVSINNTKASHEVAQTFLDLGHKNFAVVSIAKELSDRASNRKKAFIEYLKRNDIKDVQDISYSSDESTLLEKLKTIYSNNMYPTAIFCSNDFIAVEVINILKKLNIDVPKDVSIIGFDGIKLGELIQPTLSTVVQPSFKMGETAISQLIGLISKEKEEKIIHLSFNIKIAGSTAPLI